MRIDAAHLGLEERQVESDDDKCDGPEFQVARERNEGVIERSRSKVGVTVEETSAHLDDWDSLLLT